MQIAMFGATGRIGSRILDEALARGHTITAIVRDEARRPDRDVAIAVGDVTDAESVAATVAGHDAVISAVSGTADKTPETIPAAAHALVAGLPAAGVDRLLVVGGAGSLRAPDGVRIIDRPQFPEAWKAGSAAQIEALEIFRSDGDALQWTYLSPADVIEPGERTGRYVLGDDDAVFDADGEGRISMEDYAKALIDELEEPRHVRRRFTLGYV